MTTHVLTFLTVFTILPFSKDISAQQQPEFWHITDLHYDLNYSTAAGDKTKMCWNVPDGNNVPLGQYGDYSCDAPLSLVKSVLIAMKTIQPKPAFILWTGDDTAHVGAEHFSLDVEVDIMTFVTKEITDVFPDVPIVPVLGNHDSYPKYEFPASRCKFYERIADLWKDWIGDNADTFRKGGYYSKMLPIEGKGRVKVLGLNTPLYYDKNRLVDASNLDPAGQFAWMESELADAVVNGYKVYVVAHIPPGMFERKVIPQGYSWMKDIYNKRLNDIFVNNGATIAAMFFGHHHTDSFRVFTDPTGAPVTYALIAPAVTPWNTTLPGIGPNNPGVRLFHFDQSDGKVTNYQQYFLKLDQANQVLRDAWELEYDFLQAYRLTELSATSLGGLARSFQSNQTYEDLFEVYYKFNSVSYAGNTSCDNGCRQNHFCAITQVDYPPFRICNAKKVQRQSDLCSQLTGFPLSICGVAGLDKRLAR